MNAVIIAFLVVLAGPLLRRYGLGLGIVLNPVVVLVAAVLMVVVLVGPGPTSLALLLVVSAARILDLALSDGATRTSVNAMYQVLPPAVRVEAQATVEGMGVPVAIGVSGVMLLLINLAPDPLPVTIGTTVVVCAAWTAAALVLRRAYRPALAGALRRGPLLDETEALVRAARETVATRRLLARGDAGSVRLALDVVPEPGVLGALPELRMLASDPDPEVRLTALAALAAREDSGARARLADEVAPASGSADPAVRAAAAAAVGEVDGSVRTAALTTLLADPAPTVRAAALRSVGVEDGEPGLSAALTALEDPHTVAAAGGAVRRFGDGAVGALELALAGDATASPATVRLVRAVAPSPARDAALGEYLGRGDPALGLAVVEALGAGGPSSTDLWNALDAMTSADLARAVELLEAVVLVDATAPEGLPAPTGRRALRHALRDELELVRRRVRASLTARHGSTSVGPALAALGTADSDLSLAVESLEVSVGAPNGRAVAALLDPRTTDAEQLAALRGILRRHAAQATVDGVVARLAAGGSPGPGADGWLRTCAVAAAEQPAVR